MNPKLIVQSLQGMRSQILLAFLFAGHAMDLKELMTYTGKPRNSHYSHLNALCGAGLLAKQSFAHGRDLYLLRSEMLPALQAWVAQIGAGQVLEAGAIDVTEEFSAAGSQPALQMSENRTPEELADLKAALDENRIVNPTRNKLLAAEWVSGPYVRAWVAYFKAEAWCDNNPVGAAIRNMLEGLPMPALRENGHPENCKCPKCTVDDVFGRSARRKYLSFICDTCGQHPCVCDEEEE